MFQIDAHCAILHTKFPLSGKDPRSHLFDLSCFTFLHRAGSQEVKVAVSYITSFVER